MAASDTVRLIVVEDHNLVREGIVAMLEAEDDLEVIGEAAAGDEGLDLCLRLKPDVVLLDLRLPGMDGLEVLRRLKADLPAARVVVLTVHDEEAYVGEALRSGADGYMLKTTTHKELSEAVRAVMRGQAMLHPAVAKKVLENFATMSRGGRSSGQLSTREREIVRLLAQGQSNKQIARTLSIGIETVKTHVSSILEKLGAADRAQAVALAFRRGLVE